MRKTDAVLARRRARANPADGTSRGWDRAATIGGKRLARVYSECQVDQDRSSEKHGARSAPQAPKARAASEGERSRSDYAVSRRWIVRRAAASSSAETASTYATSQSIRQPSWPAKAERAKRTGWSSGSASATHSQPPERRSLIGKNTSEKRKSGVRKSVK